MSALYYPSWHANGHFYWYCCKCGETMTGNRQPQERDADCGCDLQRSAGGAVRGFPAHSGKGER